MGILTRLREGCLRAAARRWPDGIRDDLVRAWHAEVAALDAQPGGRWRSLTFAVSLAASPMRYDEDGVPSVRWEWLRAPGPLLRLAAGLVLAGGFGVGLWLAVRLLVTTVLIEGLSLPIDGPSIALLYSAASTLVTSGYAVAAGRWLAVRAAAGTAAGTAAIGDLARAAIAVAVLGAVLVVWLGSGEIGFAAAGPKTSVAAVAAWAVVTFGVVVVTSRRVAAGRILRAWGAAVVGTPLAAWLAAAVGSAFTSLTSEYDRADGVVLLYDPLWLVLAAACTLLPSTLCAVSFGWAAARARPLATADPTMAAPPGPRPDDPPRAASPVRNWPPDAAQVVAVLAAAGAAVVWAVGIAVLQSPSEPTSPYAGQNNTYWVRELRWDAIVAVVLAVVVCAGGRRRAVREAVLGGLAWVAVDIALDRAELSHGVAPLAVGAVVVAVAGCYRGATDHSGAADHSGATDDRDAARGAPGYRVLLNAAGVAAVLAGLATLTESAEDTEWALNPGSAAVGCVLALVALAAALTAAPRRSRGRHLAAAAALATGAAPWVLRAWWPRPMPARSLAGIGLILVLLACVTALARRRPRRTGQWLWYPVIPLGAMVSALAVVYVALLALMIMDVGGVLTALAGNPAINSADEDVIDVVPGVLAGLAAGRLLARAPTVPRGRSRDLSIHAP